MSRTEDKEIEDRGAEWAARSDAYLVGWVSQTLTGRVSTPAIVEMQRRMVAATEKFNEESSTQVKTMIRLTRWITALTVTIGLIAILQLAAMVWQR